MCALQWFTSATDNLDSSSILDAMYNYNLDRAIFLIVGWYWLVGWYWFGGLVRWSQLIAHRTRIEPLIIGNSSKMPRLESIIRSEYLPALVNYVSMYTTSHPR